MNPVCLQRATTLCLLLLLPALAFAQTGSVSGTVVDAATGEGLFGVNVLIEGTTTGTTTDLAGRYTLPGLAPGTYNLVFRYLGYHTFTVASVEIVTGETARLDVQLQQEALTLEEEIVVEARALRNNETMLLKDRQKAAAVSDAISAEAISRAGASNAADAVEKITGVSVVGGKYVYVRGLGDRYMNTQLNGATLPSADPDANTVPFDLFSSDLLDNIVTVKTFTPDKPGSFTGGNVNLTTRDFPDAFRLVISASAGYNSEVTFSNAFLTYQNAQTGTFAIPQAWRTLPGEIETPTRVSARFDPEQAALLHDLSKSFAPVMTPTMGHAPLNRSFSVYTGNRLSILGGRTLGYVATVSYDQKYAFYDDGTANEWRLDGNAATSEELTPALLLSDRRGTSETLLGGLGTLSLQLSPAHKVTSSFVYNRSTESGAYSGSGRELLGNNNLNAVFQTHVLQYTERTMRSLQFRGDHLFPALAGLRAEWNIALNRTSQHEPDRRLFASTMNLPGGSLQDTTYSILLSNYDQPSRYFRTLEEEGIDGRLDLSLPFGSARSVSGSFKIGGAVNLKDRTFRERLFQYDLDQGRAPYQGNAADFFDRKTGIVDTVTTSSGRQRFNFGNLIVENTILGNNYDGRFDVYAAYAMAEVRPMARLRVIGGARFEATRQHAASIDATLAAGTLDANDVLPALSMVYELTPTMNVRAAYGRTLARPTLREISPFCSFNFIGAPVICGNPDLVRTQVDNFDLRWEWFTGPGQVLAVSGYYKAFENPLEIVRVSINKEYQYRNVESGTVFGLEVEGRQRLSALPGLWGRLELGGNVTLAHSEVSIDPKELLLMRAKDPQASDKRQLTGQSPYVVNADLTYNDLASETTASLLFNVFGPRLTTVLGDGTPDVFERPAPSLDFVLSTGLPLGVRLKASARNLLGAKYTRSSVFKGSEFLFEQYEIGRTFSLSLSYAF